MKISLNWLQTYFDSKLPDPKKLADLFALHSFEIEGTENTGGDFVFEVKILPDRAHYLLCHKGIAREIEAVSGLKRKNPAEKAELKNSGGFFVDVKITAGDLCKRYMALGISGVSVGESPKWLKERLESVGQKSINNLVDLANFVMLDIGQPMHVFDADLVKGAIDVRKAKPKEEIILLTEEKIGLSFDDLVIADDDGPLAIAGTKGGRRAEVTFKTKRIIVESANFDPVSVRKTSTRLNLRTDASKRFENELTPVLAEEGMAEMLSLILKMSPEVSAGSVTDIYPNPEKEWSVNFSANYISDLIGAKIGEDSISDILSRIGCKVRHDRDKFVIIPPMDRLDIKIPEDVADEIARIWGYENLSSKMPPEISEKTIPDKLFFYSEKVKDALIPLGFSEVMLYSLTGKGAYEITHPLANDKAFLRESLLQKLSESIIFNRRNSDYLGLDAISPAPSDGKLNSSSASVNPQNESQNTSGRYGVKIFEIGKVFTPTGEKAMLAIGVSKTKKKAERSAEELIDEAVKSVEKVLVVKIEYEIESGDFGAICEIDFGKVIADLSDKVDISGLNFKSLPQNKKYQKISAYPYISRDISVFVPESVSADEIKKIIEDNAGPLCIKNWLFDEFKKETCGAVKKSYAFRMIFQSQERTLEDKEANDVMEKIYAQIRSHTGWEIR